MRHRFEFAACVVSGTDGTVTARILSGCMSSDLLVSFLGDGVGFLNEVHDASDA